MTSRMEIRVISNFVNMKSGYKIKKILFAILIVAVLGIAVVLVMNTERFRTWRLEKQLSDQYGVTFRLEAEEQNPPLFSFMHCYMLTSDDDIRAYAKCDWKGKLISDSYAHFYYADEMADNLQSLIGSCFDECFVVRDCLEYGSDLCLREYVSTKDSRSFEAYSQREPEITVTYRVYVDFYVSAKQLQNALELLREQNADYSVYFLMVTPEEYEIIRDAGLKCYYPHSDVCEVYRNADTPIGMDPEALVYNPFDYTVAEYVPKYDSVKVYDDFHERNREYFENVDRNHTLKEIFADIGYCSGIEGSGIIRYIWTLNDGTKASVIFDSSGHIEFISIWDEKNQTAEQIYDRYPPE